MKNNSLIINRLKIGKSTHQQTCTINGVSIALKAGELLLIQGASGSGKSLFLKTIAGIIQPISGEIYINEQRISGTHTGLATYIGSQHTLRNYRSVRHNVDRWARASHHPELTEAAIHYFELDAFEKNRLNMLSDGYRQRVLLTPLITAPNGLWLLDDPFAHLDAEGAALLNALIQTRLEQKGIVLLATHQNFEGARVRTLNLSEQTDLATTIQ